MSKDTIGKSNVLITLGVLFTLGGAMRLLPHSEAIAEASLANESLESDPVLGTSSLVAPMIRVESTGQVCFSGETAGMLREDQAQLATDQAELNDQRLSLQALQQELAVQTVELQTLYQTLDARWQEMQGASDGDMQHLASMYAAMKPDEAALIFNRMDPAFAAGFLRLLPSEHAGQIVASMETNKAYTVSVKLAGMNSDIRLSERSN